MPRSFQAGDDSARQTDSAQTLTQLNQSFSTIGISGSKPPRSTIFAFTGSSELRDDGSGSSSSASQPLSAGTNDPRSIFSTPPNRAQTPTFHTPSSVNEGSGLNLGGNGEPPASALRLQHDEAAQAILGTQGGGQEASILPTIECTPDYELREQSSQAHTSTSIPGINDGLAEPPPSSPAGSQRVQQKTDTGKARPSSKSRPSPARSSSPQTPKNDGDRLASSPAAVRQRSSLSTPERSGGRRRSATRSSYKLVRTDITSADFDDILKEHGVVIGNALEPENFREIQKRLSRPRRPLPPEDFDEFGKANENAWNESVVKHHVVPILIGQDIRFQKSETKFNNLPKFFEGDGIDFDFSAAQPDQYDGCKSTDIYPVVREYADLEKYIMPSTDKRRLCLPNFFLELKGPPGKYCEVRRQACYDGVLGARGMHKLRCLTNEDNALDGNAYTITATFAGGAGNHTLTLYAVHPISSQRDAAFDEDGELAIDYRMTLLRSFALCDSSQTYQEGVTALRNAYDWAREQRDILVAEVTRKIE